MSSRPYTPRRRFRGRRNREGAAAPGHGGASAGTPRFLAKPQPTHTDADSASEREARTQAGGPAREAPVATPLGRSAAEALRASPTEGRRLGREERGDAEARHGEDFTNVVLEEQSPLAAAFGVGAMTYGDAIHVAPSRSADSSLLGHELAHVAQQRRFGGETAQFDLDLFQEDTGLGTFDMDMDTAIASATSQTGMRGTIEFMPHEFAPYANRIGLIQTADNERLDRPGEPEYEWTGGEANREDIKTDEGTFIDMLHANLPADRNAEPWYWEGHPSGDPDVETEANNFGWNRSATDRGPAELWDFPKSSGLRRFSFETVAFGRDSRTIYGSVRWGFEIAGTNLTENEWVEVPQIFQSGTGEQYQSDVFDQALGNFRDFYVHEPIIVYFGYDERAPTDAELGKMSGVLTYMTENPDAQIRLTASADMQGGVGSYNRQLALDRLSSVQTHLLSLGIDPGRIVRDETGANASSAEGSTDPALRSSEGSRQANRRVTLTFENTASAAP